MRNHVITAVGRTIQHLIFPLNSKPMDAERKAPIKIVHTQEDRNERINSCLAALKKELEGEP